MGAPERSPHGGPGRSPGDGFIEDVLDGGPRRLEAHIAGQGIGVGIQYKVGVAAPRGTSLGFYVGLDLGQARDLSAVVILERIWRRGLVDGRGRALLLHHIRYAMRYERGTPYPDVVQHVAETFYDNEDIFYYEDNVPRSSGRPPQIAIDATGVGAAVRDQFVKAGVRRPYLRP